MLLSSICDLFAELRSLTFPVPIYYSFTDIYCILRAISSATISSLHLTRRKALHHTPTAPCRLRRL